MENRIYYRSCILKRYFIVQYIVLWSLKQLIHTTWVTDCMVVVFEYAFKLVPGGLTSSAAAAGSSSVLTNILTPSASRSIIPPRCCCRRYKAAMCFCNSLNSAVTEKSVAASTSIGGGADHKLSTSQLIDSRQTGHIA